MINADRLVYATNSCNKLTDSCTYVDDDDYDDTVHFGAVKHKTQRLRFPRGDAAAGLFYSLSNWGATADG